MKFSSRINLSRLLWGTTALVFIAGVILMEFDQINLALFMWLIDPFIAGMAFSTLSHFYRRIAKITFWSILLIVILTLVFSIGYIEGLAFSLMALPFVVLGVTGYMAGIFLQKKLNFL